MSEKFKPETQAEVRRKTRDWYRSMARPALKEPEPEDAKEEEKDEDSSV